MTTSAAVERSHNSETTTTIIDLFASSTSASGANDKTSLKPQLETSPVWRTSGVYASSSWKTITFADRQPVAATGNNTGATVTTAAANGVGSVSTAPVTRFSGSSDDVISLTQPAAAAATAEWSASRETTTRPFEPVVSAGATTTELFSAADDDSAVTEMMSKSHARTHKAPRLPTRLVSVPYRVMYRLLP